MTHSTVRHETWLLFGAVIAVLVLASVVTMVLRWRVAGGRPHAVIDNLAARVSAWWWMVGVLGVAFAAGQAAVVALFCLLSLFALREFITITTTRRGDHRAIVAAFFVFLPLQYALVYIEWYGLFAICIPVYAFLILPILSALSSETTRFLERCAETQWAVMVCVFCISHVPALMILPIPGFEGRNLLLIAFLVIVVQGSDVLQYVWGKLVGQRRIAPLLSPSKTIEGFVGGVASASLLGASLWRITPYGSPWKVGVVALVIALMGFLGGLVMSAIKRDRGIKDWGHMIQGHGGILDRLDSIAFAAPIFFHITRYWWVP
ncbi:phosphatidate cytidylyltransferase [Burkholderia pyrrocinia]|uniref:phosphatidate cytidylyltransferase n=1 Tax=Burkholderia pyrrocinia TaxID=60550 RepID=UPI00157702D1|nr:phosphatidate cytidylyltransferase [Burkholderia pyrrocinia]NTX26648.1 phosphatidate cytidylyltransferase [Burkholderia pyrrocinia]